MKLNIGSGQRQFDRLKGWVNVDCVSRPGQEPDVVCDARKLEYRDNVADMVVLHHVIEHFGCGEADGVIREARRVLKPGGSLLVFVPDLRALATRWLVGQVDDFIYTVNLYGAYQGEDGDRHKWGYSAEGLHKYLKQFGWADVRPFNWREVAGANFARDWWICGMEAVK